MTESRPRHRGPKIALAILAGLAALAALGYSSIRLRPDPNEVALGVPAPSTAALIGPDGQPFSLSGLEGLPVLVFYRGHW